MKKKILITTPLLGEGVKQLKEKFEVIQCGGFKPLSKSALINHIKDCHGLLCVGNPVDKEVLDNAPLLEVVSQAAVGIDNIDIAYCTEKKIPVGNTPGVLVSATANLGILHILNGLRGFSKGNQEIKNSNEKLIETDYTLGRELEGKNLVIIGFGQIGRNLALKAAVFGFNIYACSPHFTEDTEINGTTVKAVSFEEGIKIADVLTLCLPLIDASRNLVDKHVFTKMKNDAVLVNIARGPIVNTEDLYNALKNGEIGFASLDVLDPEPIRADHKLFDLENVFLTPHMGSSTIETRTKMADLAVRNLINGLEGIPLETSVNQGMIS
jgi:glyoxylate reductase